MVRKPAPPRREERLHEEDGGCVVAHVQHVYVGKCCLGLVRLELELPGQAEEPSLEAEQAVMEKQVSLGLIFDRGFGSVPAQGRDK